MAHWSELLWITVWLRFICRPHTSRLFCVKCFVIRGKALTLHWSTFEKLYFLTWVTELIQHFYQIVQNFLIICTLIKYWSRRWRGSVFYHLYAVQPRPESLSAGQKHSRCSCPWSQPDPQRPPCSTLERPPRFWTAVWICTCKCCLLLFGRWRKNTNSKIRHKIYPKRRKKRKKMSQTEFYV